MSETNKKYNIWNSFTDGIRKYFQLRGRANRYEYWGFVLMELAIMAGFSVLTSLITFGAAAFAARNIFVLWLLFGLFALDVLIRLFLIIPSITIVVRRLHDINRSGWWILLPFGIFLVLTLFAAISAILDYIGIDVDIAKNIIFIIGGFALVFSFFYLLYLLCKKSVDEGNKYGEPNTDAKEDKYGVKFIWIYFGLVLLSSIIVFSTAFYNEYSEAVRGYEMQKTNQEFFIPESEFDGIKIIDRTNKNYNEEGIVVDDEYEINVNNDTKEDIEENMYDNVEDNVQDFTF